MHFLTGRLRYNRGMTISVQGAGVLYTLAVFLLCVIVVHAVKLIRLGLRARKNLPDRQPNPEQPTPEPVYYIVEKKKKRPKPSYSDPKRFTFKD